MNANIRYSRAARVAYSLLTLFTFALLLALSLLSLGRSARASGFVFQPPPYRVTVNFGLRNNVFYVGHSSCPFARQGALHASRGRQWHANGRRPFPGQQ